MPDRLMPSRPMDPRRQMKLSMPVRALDINPVACAVSLSRVGLLNRSPSVGWFVLRMSKLQLARTRRPAAIARCLVRMVRTPPGW